MLANLYIGGTSSVLPCCGRRLGRCYAALILGCSFGFSVMLHAAVLDAKDGLCITPLSFVLMAAWWYLRFN